MRHLSKLAITITSFLAACSSEEPASRSPPQLDVTAPARGTMTAGLTTIAVRGTVAPSLESDSKITHVRVNDVDATVGDDGAFAAEVPLVPGANFLQTVAIAADGNQANDTRAVVTGTLKPASTTIDHAMSAALSPAALDRLGDAAATLIEQSDLGAFVAPMNPVVASGLSDGQEDCLYAKASVLPGLDIAQATLGIVPVDGGVSLDVDLHGLVVPLHARFAVACIDGDQDITVRASRAHITGALAVMVNGGKFDVKLSSPQVQLEGFQLSASGVPGQILSLLHLDSQIGSVLSWAVERFMAPMFDQALRGGVAVGPQTLDVLGKSVEVAVTPAGIAFDEAGAEVMLDGRMRVKGSEAPFVYTEDQVPPMRTGAGFELAVADDTINQAFAGFWGAGALNIEKVQNFGMYDSVALHALLPPVVSPASDGTLRVAMGDLLVDFKLKGEVLTKMAMNLELKLLVEPNAVNNGAARLTLETQRFSGTVLGNTTGVPDEVLEKLLPGVALTMVDNLRPLLGAIPLPSVYGISVTDLHVGGDTGYITVAGKLN